MNDRLLLSWKEYKKRGVTSRATTPLGRGSTLNSGGSVLPYVAVVRAAPALVSKARASDASMMPQLMPLAMPWDQLLGWHIQSTLHQVRHKVAHAASLALGAFLNTLKNHPAQHHCEPLGGSALVLACVHENLVRANAHLGASL